MEAIKNYVVIDDCYSHLNNENFKAIPDKYKTLNIYMTHKYVDVVFDRMMNWGAMSCGGDVEEYLDVISDAIVFHAIDVEGKDKMLISKWLFELSYYEDYVFDAETGEVSLREEEDEEDGDSDHSC